MFARLEVLPKLLEVSSGEHDQGAGGEALGHLIRPVAGVEYQRPLIHPAHGLEGNPLISYDHRRHQGTWGTQRLETTGCNGGIGGIGHRLYRRWHIDIEAGQGAGSFNLTEGLGKSRPLHHGSIVPKGINGLLQQRHLGADEGQFRGQHRPVDRRPLAALNLLNRDAAIGILANALRLYQTVAQALLSLPHVINRQGYHHVGG